MDLSQPRRKSAEEDDATNTMKNRLLSFVPILVVLLLSAISICSQTAKIGVEFEVAADDPIKSDIESYVRREFRSLRDIDIYSSKKDFIISLVAIKPGSAVVVSVVVQRVYDFSILLEQDLNRTNIQQSEKKRIVDEYAISRELSQHFVMSDSIANLDSLCKSIVTSIDAKSFESKRKINRALDTALESDPKSTKDLPQTSGPVFEEKYVGGNLPPTITVKNVSDRTMNLLFGGIPFTVLAGGSEVIKTTDGGIYQFKASAPGVRSLEGSREFKRGYSYSWTFFIRKGP